MGRFEVRAVTAIRIVRTFAVLGTALVLLANVAAAAGDSDGDGIPDDLEAATARNVVTQDSGGGFVIRSRSVGAPQDDAFHVSYDRGVFTAGYAPSSSGPDAVTYTVAFRSLEEFYVNSYGDREVVKGQDLRGDYAGVRSSYATTTDGEREFVYTAQTRSGLFTVTVGATERFARINGTLVSPMEVKIDLAVQGWSWNTTRTDTLLGLKIEVNSTALPKVEGTTEDEAHGWATDETQVDVSSAGNMMFFSWGSTATVDGSPKPVQATALESKGGQGYEMYFVYPRGNAIFHDPKIGAVSSAFWSLWGRPAPVQGDLAVYVAALGVAAGLVAVTVLIRRRRRAE